MRLVEKDGFSDHVQPSTNQIVILVWGEASQEWSYPLCFYTNKLVGLT